MGKNVMRVKVLVCLLFLALVSAMVLLSKHLLLALIYTVSLISADEFDRNALLDAVAEAQKDSGYTAITGTHQVSPARDSASLPR
jgi:hypothetical protein